MTSVSLTGSKLAGDNRTQQAPRIRTAVTRAGRLDRWLATQLQRITEPAAVRVELWDGSSPWNHTCASVGDMVVRDRAALLGLILNGDLWFGEAYMSRRMEIRGELQPVIDALSRVRTPQHTWRHTLAATLALPNTLSGSRRNVQHHYDLGNDFYRLWLDPELVYTCAYYERPDMLLEDAQRAKMDLVCRKVRLRPGETVIEAGCGWGSLALHMAREYGVRVRAFNVSREQLEYARDRASREGLSSRVDFIDDDYRNVTGQCDVFVSVGMLEHVGLRHFSVMSDVLKRTLRRDGGRGLLHFIGRDFPRPLNVWIRRRIFPGAYAPTLEQVAVRIMAPAGMTILDVENLRLHYARTLAHWAERFARAKQQVRDTYGEAFERAWELYLAGSQAAFTTGSLQLFQVVFAPRESSPPYWTRSEAHLHGR